MVGPSLCPINGDRPQGTVAIIANGPQAAKPFWAMGSYRTIPYFFRSQHYRAGRGATNGKATDIFQKGAVEKFSARFMLTVLAMVSLRNGSAELFRRKPKLANTQEFPRGNSVAMNYSRCCV
jgi:hypothetical protein